MLKGAKTGVPGGAGSGVVDMGGVGGGGGNVMRSCGANADSADDMEDRADSGDWNCAQSPSPLDTESVARRGGWLKDDSVFIDSLAVSFTTPPLKFSLAGVRLGSSEADIDLGDCSMNGLLLGVVECMNDGSMDLPAVVTAVCAGGAI